MGKEEREEEGGEGGEIRIIRKQVAAAVWFFSCHASLLRRGREGEREGRRGKRGR